MPASPDGATGGRGGSEMKTVTYKSGPIDVCPTCLRLVWADYKTHIAECERKTTQKPASSPKAKGDRPGEGHRPVEERMNAECNGCGETFAYDPDSGLNIKNFEPKGDNHGYFFGGVFPCCPHCGARFIPSPDVMEVPMRTVKVPVIRRPQTRRLLKKGDSG